MVKLSNHGKGVVPFPNLGVVAIEKGALWSPSTTVAQFILLIIRCRLLAEIRWSVCMSKSHRSLCVPFSRTDAGLCIYHLFVWPNLNFLHISQWIILLIDIVLILIACFLWNQSDSKSRQLSRSIIIPADRDSTLRSAVSIFLLIFCLLSHLFFESIPRVLGTKSLSLSCSKPSSVLWKNAGIYPNFLIPSFSENYFLLAILVFRNLEFQYRKNTQCKMRDRQKMS